MAGPLILSTWSFGKRANAAAWEALAGGGSSLDAVEAACRDAEEDLTNHTVGVGGYPDREGRVSLDASIMLAPARCGSVAGLRRHAPAVSVARAVMEKTRHVLLVGEGADEFASAQGFAARQLLTEEARQKWEQWKARPADGRAAAIRNVEELGLEESHDTIGVLAIDQRGLLAGACSTSGLAFKLSGRVGDSPIIGHGLYVDPGVGAAVATGHGELVMGVCGSFAAVEAMRRGAAPLEAGIEVLRRIERGYELQGEDQAGLIILRRDGIWSGVSLRPGFSVAVRTADRDELAEPAKVLIER